MKGVKSSFNGNVSSDATVHVRNEKSDYNNIQSDTGVDISYLKTGLYTE